MTATYLSNYLGVATVETTATRKQAGFDGNFTYGMENVSSNSRNLMNPDELLKMDNRIQVVMVRGRKPFVCNKYMYIKHPDYNELEDMTMEEQKELFKDNLETEKDKKRKTEYSFKTF